MSRDLLIPYPYTARYYAHTADYWTRYNPQGEAYFTTNGESIGSEYIPINPAGNTYYYDAIITVNAGNQFYIGFERYDKDFTPRSNDACVYFYTTKPAEDYVYRRYTGTIDLSTDGVNPCAYIALRILNGWSGTDSGVTGTATLHYLSLREVSTTLGFEQTKIMKSGIVQCDTMTDKNNKMSVEKYGLINGTDFIEI